MGVLGTAVAAALVWALGPGGPPPPPPGDGSPRDEALGEDYVPPFRAKSVSLADVLQYSVEHNADLAIAETDVEITDAAVMAALGAYDVQLVASMDGSISEYPQRGSQLAVALGSRRFGGGLGVRRAIETGGSVALTLESARMLTDQPTNILDPSQGTTQLRAFAVVPSLEIKHAVLRGAGLKVNRAPIKRAKIAKSAAEAARRGTAQTVARDIIWAYWDLLFAHRDLDNRRASLVLAQKQHGVTLKLVAAGRRSKADAKVTAQGVAAREADVLAAEHTLLQQSLRLHTLMGNDIAEVDTLGLLPTTDPAVTTQTVVVEDEVKRALKNNPEIRRAELSIATGRVDEKVAANAKLPQLDVESRFTPQGRSVDTVANPMTGEGGQRSSWGGAFGNMFNGNPSRDGLLADWTLQGSVSLTWDVQNRSAKGAHEQAQLEVQRAKTQLGQVRRQVAASVITAASSLRTTGKVIDVADLRYELAQENLRAEQARFNVGRATNYDVLLRLDEVDDAAAEALQAQIAYLKALAELQALTGELLVAYGITP